MHDLNPLIISQDNFLMSTFPEYFVPLPGMLYLTRFAGLWGQVYIQVHTQMIVSPSGILDVLNVGNGVFDDLCQNAE